MQINLQHTFLLIIFFLFCSICLSQEETKVHASGTSISRDISPKEALQEALKEAKMNAYRRAGIAEQVSVSSILLEESDGDTFLQFFNEISVIESNASLVVDSIYPEINEFDQYGNMIVTVEIDATVFKYSNNRDPAFFFKVEGIKETYYENEHINFSFTPSQNGYLKIFSKNENNVILLYPYSPDAEYLSDDKERMFIRGETVRFPIHPAYQPGYSIEINSGKETEINNLIFIYTKNDIPLLDKKLKMRDVYYWIANIPPDLRSSAYYPIIVKKKP